MFHTVLFAAGLLLAGCGSNAGLLAERNRGEAAQLQDYCKRAGLATAETKRADDFVAKSQIDIKEGDDEGAAQKAELAVTLYRLALARKDLADTQAQVEGLRQALAKEKDQLQTYSDILQEIKTVRKP